MTTPAWRLSDDPPPEEIEWKGNLWWFTIDVSDWIDQISDKAIAALTAAPVVYGWDGKQWNVVPWTLPGDVPSLIGYRGGPLHVCTSHDPAPVGDPRAVLLVAGAGTVMGGNVNARPTYDTPCQIIGCYIEPQP